MAEIWGLAVSTVIGAGSAVYGANKAAGAASSAAKASNAEQARQFDLVRQDTAKLRGLGDSAIDTISRLYGYAPAETRKLGTRVLKPSELGHFLEQGMSIDDILKIGTFEPGAKTSDISGLMSRHGLTSDDINRLQNGTFSPATQGGPGGTGTPDMSAFFTSPDYQFNLQEGQRAIDNSAIARGGLLSGAAVKAGQRYASGLASREFGSFYDRLAQQAGLGVTGIGASASAGANAANNISNAYMNSGMARGSAYMAGAQGVNNAVQGGISNFLLMKYLGNSSGSSSGFGGP